MKVLNPLQYEYLCAVGRQDVLAMQRISEILPPHGEMFERGLYTAEEVDQEYIDLATARLTSAGRMAMMCYQALHIRD